MRLRYTSRALNDLVIAFEWYEEQRRGLGFDFLQLSDPWRFPNYRQSNQYF
jgi:hypothetical protein